MDVVLHEQFCAPLAISAGDLLRDNNWLPDDLVGRLHDEDAIKFDTPRGSMTIWRADAWDRAEAERFFYVTATDAGREHMMAGPYQTRREAEDRVRAVCAYACDRDGRAHFMGWGTASSLEPITTPLGEF
ncbi:hypothetical protein [Roseovarius nitratireducens]|uniref:hypothetical protein n=1 Tax=Roseovarius nitratireducens TaxID=2044597 RepID=UPI000CE16C74|nr:hypothetical protein [Roseovarius nitratireducens]